MPGYDLERFVSLSKTEEDELSCGICLCIFIQPLVTICCQQIYCRDCIRDWLNNNSTCPNDRQYLEYVNLIEAPRLVHNLLNKLEIRCGYIKNGCNEVVALEALNAHLKFCKYNPDGDCRDYGCKVGVLGQHNCIVNLLDLVKLKNETIRENVKTITLLENEIKAVKEFCINMESNVQKWTEENLILKQSKTDLESENAKLIAKLEYFESLNSDQDKISNQNIGSISGSNLNLDIIKKSPSANRWKSMDSLQNQNQGKKGRKLTKEDIGVPTNSQHIQHIGWNPNTGFDLENVDPNLIKFFYEFAGVSEEQLTDEDTRTFIYDFIDKHGGIDAAIEEISLPAPSTRSYLSGPQLIKFYELAGVSEEQLTDKDTRSFIFDFIDKHGGVEAAIEEIKKRQAPPMPSAPPISSLPAEIDSTVSSPTPPRRSARRSKLNVAPNVSTTPEPTQNATPSRPSLSPKPSLPLSPQLTLATNYSSNVTHESRFVLADQIREDKQLNEIEINK